MDIGQTFFYSENILSTAPVQHLSQQTSYTEFPAPPPPLRISTWISIIVALVSKCSCGRLSLRKCHRSEATQDIAWTLAGRLQEVLKWWNLLPMLLGVISLRVRYCGESPRPSGSVLGLRTPGLEFLCRIPDFCVWRAASFYSSHHPQEVSLAQFNLYVLKGGIKSHSSQSEMIVAIYWLGKNQRKFMLRKRRRKRTKSGDRKQWNVRFFVYVNISYMQF